jgi:hypothetical protein
MNTQTSVYLGLSLNQQLLASLSLSVSLYVLHVLLHHCDCHLRSLHRLIGFVQLFLQRVHRHLRVWHYFQLVVCAMTVES